MNWVVIVKLYGVTGVKYSSYRTHRSPIVFPVVSRTVVVEEG